jgi:hypothetical protein
MEMEPIKSFRIELRIFSFVLLCNRNDCYCAASEPKTTNEKQRARVLSACDRAE